MFFDMHCKKNLVNFYLFLDTKDGSNQEHRHAKIA